MSAIGHKCVILVNKSAKMTPGKVIAQAGHAIVHMMSHADKKKILKWRKSGEKIVSLVATDLEMMRDLCSIADFNKVFTHIVTDAGRTQVASGTATVCIIGPDTESRVEHITKGLKLF